MLTNVEIIWKEGIPKDTVMMTVPRTALWLECRKWTNGRWRVVLMDPMGTYRKEVWRSIPGDKLEGIFDKLCTVGTLSNKSPKAILKMVKGLLKKRNNHKATKAK